MGEGISVVMVGNYKGKIPMINGGGYFGRYGWKL